MNIHFRLGRKLFWFSCSSFRKFSHTAGSHADIVLKLHGIDMTRLGLADEPKHTNNRKMRKTARRKNTGQGNGKRQQEK